MNAGNRYATCAAMVSTIKPSPTDWAFTSGPCRGRWEAPIMWRHARRDALTDPPPGMCADRVRRRWLAAADRAGGILATKQRCM